MKHGSEHYEGRRLLVAEDDAALRSALTKAFLRRGFTAYAAASYPEAAEAAQLYLPEFVALDLKLGDRSGLELIPLMMQAEPPPKIVMLTGYASFVTAAESIKLGAVHYLAKPADPDEILTAFFKREGDPRVPVTPPLPCAAPEDEASLKLNEAERMHILSALRRHGGNISAAARELGLYRRTLQRKIAKLRPES